MTETGQRIRYEYDAEGYRVSKQVGGEATMYVIDDHGVLPQVVAELDEQGRVKVGYEYGGDRLLSQEREGEVFYSHTDGLGSVRVLTDETGRKTDSYDYEAFGELLASEGRTPNEYLFTGERYEAQLGLYDLRARFYDPEVGRFTQRDSFEGWERRPVTLHRYLYANGDPVNWVDPTGRIALFSNTVWGWTRVATLLTGAIYLGGVKLYIFQRVDSRKDIYFDMSGITLPDPCHNRGCWDWELLVETITDTIEEDFKNSGLELHWSSAPFLRRRIEFGGYSLWLNPLKTYLGLSWWPGGQVYTTEFMKHAQEFNRTPRQKNFIDTRRLGTAIGNTGSHEAGHLLGMDHDSCTVPLTIMAAGGCINVWSLSSQSDWSSSSKKWLTSKFPKL